jgi:CheY-like chemotaxis protein
VKTLGYEVEVAADGKDAIELFQMRRDEGRPFAVVILDLTVPGGMGGREVIQRLREIEPNVRAIVSSGYSSDPILANHARFGFKAVLTKPYRVDNLKSALERVLRD